MAFPRLEWLRNRTSLWVYTYIGRIIKLSHTGFIFICFPSRIRILQMYRLIEKEHKNILITFMFCYF